MIGKFGSSGWCVLNAMMKERTNQEYGAQAVMIGAEVINAESGSDSDNSSHMTNITIYES